MRWIELTVQAHPEAVEAVSELFSLHTDEAVSIEEPIELIGEGQEYRVLAGQPVIVHGYLPMDGKQTEALQRIAEGLWHLSSLGAHFVGEFQTREVKEEDWANAWKDHFYVTHIGQRLVIRPSWRDYTPTAQEVVLTLDPGMAFGTGLHPTTRLCLEQLELRVTPGMQILDVGTGSGILAIAAARLGASHVYAIDNSSVAAESAAANVMVNEMEGRVETALGVLDQTAAAKMAGQYDLVVANIIASVIGSLAAQFAQVLAPRGLLIVSGIIQERLHDALDPLLAHGLEQIDQQMIDDWMALILRKKA